MRKKRLRQSLPAKAPPYPPWLASYTRDFGAPSRQRAPMGQGKQLMSLVSHGGMLFDRISRNNKASQVVETLLFLSQRSRTKYRAKSQDGGLSQLGSARLQEADHGRGMPLDRIEQMRRPQRLRWDGRESKQCSFGEPCFGTLIRRLFCVESLSLRAAWITQVLVGRIAPRLDSRDVEEGAP